MTDDKLLVEVEHVRLKWIDHEERESATQDCIQQINRVCDLAKEAIHLRTKIELIKVNAQELVALVGHCDDSNCEGKWCVTARSFIEKCSLIMR